MRDQADKLRKLLRKDTNSLDNNSKITNGKKTRVIAITSGKGGVGKTNLTINLAISLSNLGYKVVVFDADLGLANIDIILGIIPKNTIASLIDGTKDILEILTDGPNGIKVIAGGSGIKELNNLNKDVLNRILNQFAQLENYADFILIDTGAGLSDTVLQFVSSAQETIVVTTPEPTSLTDAYAMIKTLVNYNHFTNLKIIINRADDANEASEAFQKLSKATERFLKVNIENFGYVYNSKQVIESVKSQTPIVLLYPNSPVTSKINGIALKILSNSTEITVDNGIKGFVKKLAKFFNKEESSTNDR